MKISKGICRANLSISVTVILLTIAGIHANAQTITNDLISVTFDKSTGYLSATLANGEKVITGGLFSINSGKEVYTSDSKRYSYKVSLIPWNGSKKDLIITGRDRRGIFDFRARIHLPEKMKALVTEVTYRNSSGYSRNVGSIEPLRLISGNGGKLFFKGSEKCLTNGAMYYDAGMIHDLDQPYLKPFPYGETKGGVPLDKELSDNKYTVASWWNTGLFSAYNEPFLSAGYLHNSNSLGRIQILRSDNESLSMIAESVFNPGFMLQRSGEISSDKFSIVIGDDPYQALETYSALMSGEISHLPPGIVNGWCNWFYTMDQFSEDEILRNAAFAARVFKPYGLEYIQIDEGFQTLHGEWQGNSRFPHGLKWLCDSIKSLGLKPGIWIAPYVISEGTRVFKEHPDWLLKGQDGKPKRIGPWPSDTTAWYRDEDPKRYCLDITHPEARLWLRDLFNTIVNEWGFEMVKVDFVAWTLFSAEQFYDPGVTPAQAYRETMEMLRSVAGDECHINDCGPGNISAGLINSLRIEYDQNYGYSSNAWGQYFSGNSSSSGAAGKRYLYHNKLWINDIDHVCIDLLSEANAQAVTTLIGLSGGNTISGDRLLNLDDTKLEIIRKIFPSTLENARPADLFDNDPQSIFSCRITRPFGAWDIVAFFNHDKDHCISGKISLEKLWLDPGKKYLCFDFWKQRFVGEVSNQISTTVDPGSVSLFSLREVKGVPQIIGTDRHVKMGAVEILDEKFDYATSTLHVTSAGPTGSMHSVFIYIPKGFEWVSESKIYTIKENHTVRKVEENILRVDVMFDSGEQERWSVNFNLPR